MALCIKPTIYRDRPGFLIYGRPKGNPRGWGVRIFTLTRESAEHIRDKVNRGEQTTLDDFYWPACRLAAGGQ